MTLAWKEVALALAVGLAVWLVATAARAQEPEPLPEAGAPRLSLGDFEPLRRGQASPRDGLLVAPEVMLRISMDYDALAFRLTRERERAEDTCRVQLDIERAHTRAEGERLELHVGLWQRRQGELLGQIEQARRAAERGWFENPALWAGVGALVASLVAILASQL